MPSQKFFRFSSVNVQDGFTLIETLIAVMVLGICLSVILQTFSVNLHALDASNKYNRAVFLAQEKIEELSMLNHYNSNNLQGRIDDIYEWTAEVKKIIKNEKDEKKMPFTTYKISVEIMWETKGKGKGYKISTIAHASRRLQ